MDPFSYLVTFIDLIPALALTRLLGPSKPAPSRTTCGRARDGAVVGPVRHVGARPGGVHST